MNFNTNQLMGFLGSVLLLVGVFLPLMTMPMMGSLTFMENSYGYLLIFLAIGGFICSALNKFKIALGIGIISFVIISYFLLNFWLKLERMREELMGDLPGGIFNELGAAMIDSVRLGSGWIVLFLGSLLLITSYFVKVNQTKSASTNE